MTLPWERPSRRYPPPGPDIIYGSTLKAWLRSDRGVTMVGTKVSAWADQTGNGHHATQDTDSRRPVISYPPLLSGRPAISFAAGSVYMVIPSHQDWECPDGYNLVVEVVSFHASLLGSASRTIIARDDIILPPGSWSLRARQAGVNRPALRAFTEATQLDVSGAASIQSSATRVRSTLSKEKELTIQVNDQTPVTVSDGSEQWGFSTFTTTIGCTSHDSGFPQEFGIAQVAEVILLHAIPTAAQELAWSRYLNWRYGLGLAA